MNRAEPKRAVHHGKWSLPGVPHKGWQFRGFDDLGDIVGICEMCETQPIRYVHYLGHPDYPDVLGVGSVCAENMEEDYVAARERERRARSLAARRARWMNAEWRTSRKGNEYLNRDGFNIVLYRTGPGWAYRIQEHESTHSWWGTECDTIEEAKLAAFDRFIALQG